MSKINRIIFPTFFIFLFCSCMGQLNTNDICKKKFKEARALAYADFTRQSALDSALFLTNECMKCDSIRKAVVELKITLFIAMKKYSEGIVFIDSLTGKDFTFGYQKKMMSKGLQALIYDSKHDTVNRNLVYAQMANGLEQYIKQQQLSDKEFKEVYTYLYAIKEKFLDANQINKEVEDFKKRYPEKKAFFGLFKK